MLAVSGGMDSMVLLHAAREWAAARGDDRLVVATFDHGTGPHARDASAHVQRWSRAWGLPVHAQRMLRAARGEAAWRAARWRFLRAVARSHDATVVTAHTRDDHLETVVMRILRGSGARGLSAMRAPSSVVRPFLGLRRADLEEYARDAALTWVEDPSNRDRRYLRNRVRHDLLPALLAQRPSLGTELLELAERATALREGCAIAVRTLLEEAREGHVVARGVTTGDWGMEARALLWQTLAGEAGIALDRRGTERLARFSSEGRRGARIPLAAGFEAVHRGDTIELRRRPTDRPFRVARITPQAETAFGAWRFRPAPERLHDAGAANDASGDAATGEVTPDPWRAWLPADGQVEVRAWRDGDRMIASGGAPRRVKRFFSDERVPAVDREGWPVIVLDGEIVWIPGVRRGPAATARPGRPRVCIVCERVRG